MIVAAVRVWIGCLASYNAGELRGAWLDLEDYEDEEELRGAITPLLRGEKWHVCDFDGFAPFTVGRYERLSEILKMARVIEQVDDPSLLEAAAEVFGADYVLEAVSADPGWILDQHAGCGEPGDIARELYGSDCPVLLQPYVDWTLLEESALGLVVTRVRGTRYLFHNI